MDHWPGSSTTHTLPALKKGRPRKEDKSKALDGSEGHPVVDHGSLTAANLYRKGRHLEWTTLGTNDTGRKLIARGEAVKIFPASRPEWHPEPQVSVKHQAEQGANFLRTRYPDVDIASELIREELEETSRLSSEVQIFDPYAGNLLSVVSCGARTGRNASFLAFPMGQTGCDLNISGISCTKKNNTLFKPSASPAWSFDTPIQQIASCPNHSSARKETTIAVRTGGGTKLLSVEHRPNLLHGLVAKEITSFTRSDTANQRVVDFLFHGQTVEDLAFLAVNDAGSVFRHNLLDTQGRMLPVYTHSISSPKDPFWRLASLPDSNTCLLLSSTRLETVDFRAPNIALSLATVQGLKTVFTSVEGLQLDNMIRVASTEEIIWIDYRFPLRPVVGIKHHRQQDRTLHMQSLMFGKGKCIPLTFLTSCKNGLVTVYDVSQGLDNFVHLNSLPYAIPHLPVIGSRRVGQAVFRHPSDPGDNAALVLQLSDRGSIHRLDIELNLSDRAFEALGRTHDWSQDMFALERSMETAAIEVGQVSGRSYTEVDMEPVYKRIYGLDQCSPPADDPDTFYDTLDALPNFWQNAEAPVEQVLTTFDIAFRSGPDPGNLSRTDFFTGSAINSLRGYRTLVQDRLPYEELAKRSEWHHDWTNTLRRFVPDISDSTQEMQDNFKRFDLLLDDYRPGPSLRTETEAREQLTLDLALAIDVYAPHAVQAEPDHFLDDALETMSRATEAMSIGIPEPPPVQFGFLRPAVREHYGRLQEEKRREYPLGVRLLLNEWTVGTDPHEYQYHDPYDNSEPSAAPARAGKKTEKPSAAEVRTQPARMPPVIATAPMAPPPIAASQPARTRPTAQSQDASTFRTRSQPTQLPPSSQSSQSQETMFPSTQVLPGPFGGRPAPVKKKSVKKRMGGF
ncbi:uncharacterized protein PHACADRAFT_208714 [Phanerochaete carnosa HHB-10118-sp]|uniref:RRN6 K-rich C-terminal domain-containing protein n=1 Tax=Phanerochaete carnosa (strain HHB-10118-sp) TaxID=650164 RepID=K5W7N8_PHACS|nr:uncharacterized protein PHACADRAFT_208714 [Phanerochaete carnosa HHB-10118-sp]EKM55190.1 hypothetical protein PHACADRAFT_208714 [Phanerochaete carnosa HHB-10118-sp]